MPKQARAAAPSPNDRLVVLATGSAWLLGLRAALELLRGLLRASPLAEAVLGALLVDVVAGRAGLVWSESGSAGALQARRALLGGALSLGIVAITIGVALAFGWANARVGHPDAMVLLAILGAAAIAVRDELLLRGLPMMFAERAGVPPRFAITFAAMLSPAFAFGTGTLTPASVALSFTTGLLFASIYHHLEGAPAAIVAHAIGSLAMGPLVRGGALELDWIQGELGDGTAASGAPAWSASALSLIAAVVIVPRLAPKQISGARAPLSRARTPRR